MEDSGKQNELPPELRDSRLPRRMLEFGSLGGLRWLRKKTTRWALRSWRMRRALRARLIIACTSIAIHFFFLGNPREVVWDEVYFGAFASHYCCDGVRFFDIHPPHGKLLISGGARLAGYRGGVDFSKVGNSYGRVSPVSLRWVSALAGALIPVSVFELVLQLGGRIPAAILAAMAVLFDTALFASSRYVSLDPLLVLGVFLYLNLLLRGVRRVTKSKSVWFVLAGMVGAMAVGTKVTGLVIVPISALLLLRPLVQCRNRENLRIAIRRGTLIVLGFLPVYVFGWYLHFATLTTPGPGDFYFKPTGEFVFDTIAYHDRMFITNASNTRNHPDASRWINWPTMRKPVHLWEKGDREIYMLANPVVWIGSFFLLIAVGVNFLVSRSVGPLIYQPLGRKTLIWIPACGYLLGFLPFAFVLRPLFLYHYFCPLVFGIVIGALWLDQVGWIRSSYFTRQRRSYYVVLVAVVGAFLVLSPYVYGYSSFGLHMRLLAGWVWRLYAWSS